MLNKTVIETMAIPLLISILTSLAFLTIRLHFFLRTNYSFQLCIHFQTWVSLALTYVIEFYLLESPMPLSAILTQAFNFFKNNISQLAFLFVPILFVQVGIQLWLSLEISSADLENPQFGTSHMVAMMVLLLVFSFLIAALTLFLEVRSQGHSPSNSMILKTSFNFVPALLLAGVFSGLAVLAPVFILMAVDPMLGVIGLVGSIYLFARLAFVNFMVVVERLTPMEAIKRSFSFSGPIAFKTIAVFLLYIPLSLFGGILAQLTELGGLPVKLIGDVIVAFFGLFVNVALFRLYMVSRPTPEVAGNVQNEE